MEDAKSKAQKELDESKEKIAGAQKHLDESKEKITGLEK